MARDPLAGFRGERPEQLRRAAEAARTDGQQAPDRSYDKMMLGFVAERLMVEAGNEGDAEKFLSYAIQRAEREIREIMAEFLQWNDVTTPAARDAHIEMRVRALLLAYLRDAITSGQHAAQQIESGEAEVDPS